MLLKYLDYNIKKARFIKGKNMQIEMLFSKIHRATVTDANLEYEGSITIDEGLLKASGIKVNQKVDIYNINNGERFSTYAIKGEYGKGDICLNGAAARLASKGDKVIIVAYASFEREEADVHIPTLVMVDEYNRIKDLVK